MYFKLQRSDKNTQVSLSINKRVLKGAWPGSSPSKKDKAVTFCYSYYHLSSHFLRILAHCLWDIVTGQTPLPPDLANVVCPLYKKGDRANPDNWRPIVCAVTEVKIVWTILLRRSRPHLDPHVPASLWGAIPGLSPHQAIFLQDTIADMDPVDLIIASLNVKGAFPKTP